MVSKYYVSWMLQYNAMSYMMQYITICTVSWVLQYDEESCMLRTDDVDIFVKYSNLSLVLHYDDVSWIL